MSSIEQARRRLMSGPHLSVDDREDAMIVIVVALDHDEVELKELAASLDQRQAQSPTFKPVLLVSTASTRLLGARGFAFEAVLSRDEWARLDLPAAYEEYTRGRVRSTERLYAADTVIEMRPGDPVVLFPPPVEQP